MAERLLVIDNDATQRREIAGWLLQDGFTVEEGATGADAVRLAKTLPALVVLNAALPDGDGCTVVQRIREDPRCAHMPVLLLAPAGSGTDEQRDPAREPDGYLTNPVTPEALRALVRTLLRVRRAEQALRASEERYRLVARATNDVIWDWDLAGHDVRWNSAVQTMFRYPPDAVRASVAWWHERIHPDDRDRVIAGQQKVIGGASDTWADEYRFLCADGGYVTVFDRGYVLHDESGVPVRMIGSMVDVTERKHAEERQQLLADAGTALAASLDYETTMRSMAGLVVPRVADWCLVYVHEVSGTLRLLGVAASDAQQEALLREIDRAAGIDPASSTNAIARSVRTGEAELFCELSESLLHAFAAGPETLGRLRKLAARSVIVAPMRARGHTLGTIVFGVGSDGRRYTSRDLPLACELAARAAIAMDNARLYDAAVLANSAKSDFLAVMSHELRTPLNAIVGYADLMLLGVPNALDPVTASYVERVHSCARSLLSLIEQILTFSRVETGREQVVEEPVDLELVVDEIARLAEPLAEAKGLRFQHEFRLVPTTIRTDAGKLRQILLNLLSNSVKFTQAGAVRLCVEAERGGIAFRVEDSGIGISPEHLERIFDPFWQVEQKKTRTAGGAGIGLTVSRRLAQLLGGDLTVVSNAGHGSTFVLHLPVKTEDLLTLNRRRASDTRQADAPPDDDFAISA